MAEIGAVQLDSVSGVMATDDGKHALLKLVLAGQEVVIAVGQEHLRHLLEMVAMAIGQASDKARMATKGKLAFEAVWWELGKTEQGALAISFRLGNGGELSFVLGADQIPRIRETLQSMEPGASTPPTPDKLKN